MRTAAGIVAELSLPSRGAWIEIKNAIKYMAETHVAPLTGSVDRNTGGVLAQAGHVQSLPSRGAWIEILPTAR